ncbi:MAG: gliding motility protein [Desulfobacterales bacterium]|nr:gliding motility protein [Desulfobacterales bacterium]
MATINLKKREVEIKIVYYGPGRCGKTTNLQYIFQNSRRYMIDEMVSIKTKGDLTLFFDFVPMGLGTIKGCETRVQLYTVPGQVKYASTRKLVLKGAIFHFPLVMQYNKRDLADAGVPLMPVEEMNQLYNRQLKAPHFAGSATTGLGVNDTFKSALVHTLRSIKKQAGWE